MFFLPGMEARVRRHWRIEMGALAGEGGRGDRRGGVTKVEGKEDGDGMSMGVDTGGMSPSEESERSIILWIPGSILTLTWGGVLKVEAEEWGGVRNVVATCGEGQGSP
jgi:hypothetical protein